MIGEEQAAHRNNSCGFFYKKEQGNAVLTSVGYRFASV